VHAGADCRAASAFSQYRPTEEKIPRSLDHFIRDLFSTTGHDGLKIDEAGRDLDFVDGYISSWSFARRWGTD
jgi:hypothetical protein